MTAWWLVLIVAAEQATGFPRVSVSVTERTCIEALTGAMEAAQERGEVLIDARCVPMVVPALRPVTMEDMR